MDALSRTINANLQLGNRIAQARGWHGVLATIHGAKRHPSGFSQHFVDFCMANGFADADFLKPGRAGFGGFTDGPVPSFNPAIVLVHGNGCDATVMAPLIERLLAEGYAPHDIYVVSYGKGDPESVAMETHAPAYARDLRRFLDAVRAYTGRSMIVAAHSKGVTDGLLAIHGVSMTEMGIVERFAELANVHTFIGAAGANQGLRECRDLPFLPISNRYNGFHPDAKIFGLLPQLGKVASNVYSVVARDDELESEDLKTARVPFQDGELILEHGGHMAPIWEPTALVRLIQGRHERLTHDGYESIRHGGWWSNPLSPFAFADAMLTASVHFAGMGSELARGLRGLRGDPLLRATAGVATLLHAAKAALIELPNVQFAAVLDAAQQAALAGKVTYARRH